MGLKCSLLGHAFEPTDVERERKEQGSEVITTVREMEECRRCGKQRVVAESTEVTAVVDADDVDIDDGSPNAESPEQPAPEPQQEHRGADTAGAAESAPESDEPAGGGLGGMIDRSAAVDEEAEESPTGPTAGDDGETEAESPVDTATAAVDSPAEASDDGFDSEIADRDPEEEDAEILTDEDDEPEREPGEWPEEDGWVDEDEVESAIEPVPEEAGEDEPEAEAENLSGITVPEGRIVCPECAFGVEAESGYRDGDPCPECGEWLTTERNR